MYKGFTYIFNEAGRDPYRSPLKGHSNYVWVASPRWFQYRFGSKICCPRRSNWFVIYTCVHGGCALPRSIARLRCSRASPTASMAGIGPLRIFSVLICHLFSLSRQKCKYVIIRLSSQCVAQQSHRFPARASIRIQRMHLPVVQIVRKSPKDVQRVVGFLLVPAFVRRTNSNKVTFYFIIISIPKPSC